MFRRTRLSERVMCAFCGVLLSASGATRAQDAPKLDRVEITGSAIKRIDAETAVPITVLRLDDLKREGITSVEQVIQRLAVSTSTQITSSVVGLGTGGASFADLRGLGSNKTLVLLNGRRISNNAIEGASADLNTIPFAALERVEVLRDGASALYGTDAIGGVINFITRRSYQGGEISVNTEVPQRSGGRQRGLSGSIGFGDLDSDGFNIVGVLDYSKSDRINSQQRAFGARGVLPERGIDGTSGTTFPANYSQDLGTPAAPDVREANPVPVVCRPIGAGGSVNSNGSTSTCRFDPTPFNDLTPEVEKASFFGKTAIKVGSDAIASAEYFLTRSKVSTLIGPVPQTGLSIANAAASPFYPGNGITPSPGNFTIDPSRPISLDWRTTEAGGRAEERINTQQRLVLGLEGVAVGWDYRAAVNYNENKIDDNLTGGYSNDQQIEDGVANGILNPFGPQNAAGAQALAAAALRGSLQKAKGTVYGIDARASRDVGDWFGTGAQAAVALGAEFRKEKFSDVINGEVAGQAATTGLDPAATTVAQRNVSAVYGELNVPLLKTLDGTVAVRHDRYSDFGNTTNPKFALRFQPVPEFLARATYSTGFRAPSLYDLYDPKSLTFTQSSYDDPVLCPDGDGGTNTPATISGRDCNQQFLRRAGGNADLQPEKAKNLTIGFVFEPTRDLSVGLDFWWIRLRNSIAELPEGVIFADPARFAARFNRAPDGSLDPNADAFIDNGNENLGKVRTNGIDISANYRYLIVGAGTLNFGINGTYINKYEFQQEIDGDYVNNVGLFVDGKTIFRWKHALTVAFAAPSWSVGVTNRYASGYDDENIQVDPEFFNRVSSYSVWDVFGALSLTEDLTLSAGVRNAFDKDPPFSNQGVTFQQGYDPRYTDPTGRALYARLNYRFH